MITESMIKAQQAVLNAIDFDLERDKFELEAEKLHDMRQEFMKQNPVKLSDDWCTTDGEWWV